jgi:assimilatory nitrate reductase electron transfer subunit
MSAQQVVVIGYGMAAARLLEEVRRIDPDGRRVTLTVIGEERVPAYNRILLTSVLSGRMEARRIQLQDKAWAASHNVDVVLGVCVSAIDRVGRTVLLANGERVRYDVLVLATGSRPWLPPTRGLRGADGEPAAGVAFLRTLADCETLHDLARPGATAVVLGGGVLGLEAAHALHERAAEVTVVHPMAWLMERQLDRGSGRILAAALERRGIRFRIGRYAHDYLPGKGLWLDDGSVVPADLVLVAAGTRPETALAADAGLAVDKGVMVDDRLRATDPSIFAIGDCAQHGEAVSGFVESAWTQATVLAELLTQERPSARYRGGGVVTTLKIPAIELMALGDPHVDPYTSEADVVCLTDPAGGRYAKLVVRQDRIDGAILLGLPNAAASVSYCYVNSTVVPSDRFSLLVGGVSGAGDDVAAGGQIVCLCNNVTRESLAGAWRAGARTAGELADATRATTGCGACGAAVQAMADRLARENQP